MAEVKTQQFMSASAAALADEQIQKALPRREWVRPRTTRVH